MTHEQKIEALSSKIRKALPYLNQSEQPVKLIQALQNGNSIESIKVSNCICVQLEPMLNDVLAWLNKIEHNKVCFMYYNGDFFNYNDGVILLGISWNLEKPYIKDQSEQLINFLYSLISQ